MLPWECCREPGWGQGRLPRGAQIAPCARAHYTWREALTTRTVVLGQGWRGQGSAILPDAQVTERPGLVVAGIVVALPKHFLMEKAPWWGRCPGFLDSD